MILATCCLFVHDIVLVLLRVPQTTLELNPILAHISCCPWDCLCRPSWSVTLCFAMFGARWLLSAGSLEFRNFSALQFWSCFKFRDRFLLCEGSSSKPTNEAWEGVTECRG